MPTDLTPLSDASVLIVGLARNCERTLEVDFGRLDAALASARKRRFLVVESDSTDATVDVLKRMARRHEHFRYVLLGTLADRYPKRTERLAHCRNHYIDMIQALPEYRDVTFVAMADMDGVNTHIDEAAVRSCWERSDWDVCAANQAGPYYDIWALRHPVWSPNDCWQQMRFLDESGGNHFRAMYASVFSRMVTIPPHADWIEVDSAFGGLAIYRRDALNDARYVGLSADGTELCEHVAFHADIRARGGRVFINPALINAAVNDYAKVATPAGIVRFYLRCQRDTLARRVKSHRLYNALRPQTQPSPFPSHIK